MLPRLGFPGTDERAIQSITFVKNFIYMPPEGFLMWHTNQHDNNNIPYRLYLISVDQDGGSAFKYVQPNGQVAEVQDFHGAVRLFKNTHTDYDTGEESYLWHTVYVSLYSPSLYSPSLSPTSLSLFR